MLVGTRYIDKTILLLPEIVSKRMNKLQKNQMERVKCGVNVIIINQFLLFSDRAKNSNSTRKIEFEYDFNILCLRFFNYI